MRFIDNDEIKVPASEKPPAVFRSSLVDFVNHRLIRRKNDPRRQRILAAFNEIDCREIRHVLCPRAFRLTHQFRSVRQKKRTAHAIRPHKYIRQRSGNARLSAPRRHNKQRFPPILSPECFTNRLNGAQLIIAPGDIRIDGNALRIALRRKALKHPFQIALRIKPGNNALALIAIRTNPRFQTVGKKYHRAPPEPALQRIRVFPRLKPPGFHTF